uniref:Uncharacterized protein n=1 Tax=Daphnia galeata TaxID=27404 RepID=A0A8J2WV25_9CRUS|nr:unnamed protein product [Daphnia galeata]
MHLHQQLPEFFQLQLRILDCTADLRRHLKDHLFSYNALRKKYFFGFFPSDKPSQEYCNQRKGIFMMIQPPGSSRSPSSSFGVWEHKHHQILVFYSWSFWLPVLIRTTLLVICSF